MFEQETGIHVVYTTRNAANQSGAGDDVLIRRTT